MPPPRDRPLSVVMPVHNARPHLDEAVRSILEQSFGDFEFVIFDDGSTDGSTERLQYWARQDDRIRLVSSERNLGPVASSNRAARLAHADLVARMDADDVCHRDRLGLQFELMRDRPDIGMVGTLFDVIDANGERVRGPNLWRLAHPSWTAPFPHGSVMYRRALFEELDGYRERCVFWEDHDLYWRAAKVTTIATVPDALFSYRPSRGGTRLASDQQRVERAIDLVFRCIERLKAGQDYEDLLDGTLHDDRVDPRVFVSRGSITLWAGGRPAVFRRLIARGRLGLDLTTASVLAWAAWAALHPPSLRQALRLVAGARNALARHQPIRSRAVPWRMPRHLHEPPGARQSRPSIASAPAKR